MLLKRIIIYFNLDIFLFLKIFFYYYIKMRDRIFLKDFILIFKIIIVIRNFEDFI